MSGNEPEGTIFLGPIHNQTNIQKTESDPSKSPVATGLEVDRGEGFGGGKT